MHDFWEKSAEPGAAGDAYLLGRRVGKSLGQVVWVTTSDERVKGNETAKPGSRVNSRMCPNTGHSGRARKAGLPTHRDTRDDGDELRGEAQFAIDQYACGAAHDIGNLLAGILLGLSQLRGRQQSMKQEAVVDSVLLAAEQGLCATRSLLEAARHKPGRNGIFDPNACILKIGPLLCQAAGLAVQLVLVLDPEIWTVEADASAAVLALLNLVTNGRDAMPQGGVLWIETANVALRGELDGSFVAITVMDNGLGMPGYVLARAFKPFFTTKAVGKGAGLGLAQVREFARRARGRCSIRSAVGRGTAVTLYLPRAIAAPRPDKTKSCEVRRRTISFGGPEHLLGVDQ